MKEFKLVVLGSAGVGKSAITVRFVQNEFVEKYDPTVEDSFTRNLSQEDDEYVLQIVDTAGTGFLFVYSITEAKTLECLADHKAQVDRAKDGKEFAAVVVGNKADLEAEREVSTAQGEEFTKVNVQKHFPNGVHVEASAKTGKNVEHAFVSLVRQVNRVLFGAEKPHAKNTKEDDEGKKKKNGGCLLL